MTGSSPHPAQAPRAKCMRPRASALGPADLQRQEYRHPENVTTWRARWRSRHLTGPGPGSGIFHRPAPAVARHVVVSLLWAMRWAIRSAAASSASSRS
jgi:hypothetical protein